MGRLSKYQDDFPQKLLDFFSIPLYRREIVQTIHFKNGDSKDIYGEVPNDPPFFSNWCHSVGITEAILYQWVKEDSKYFKTDLFESYKRAKELQKQFLITNGLRNNYSAAVAIFTLKNISDMRDEQHLKGVGFGDTNIYNLIQQIQRGIPANSRPSVELDKPNGVDAGRARLAEPG